MIKKKTKQKLPMVDFNLAQRAMSADKRNPSNVPHASHDLAYQLSQGLLQEVIAIPTVLPPYTP